jgi:RNA polymerase sigma-70 factor (ECF subfamily)
VLTGLSDEALMVEYQKGDARAFEVLLRRHRRPLYNFLLRFTSDREASEDLLQEAFLRVIRGAKGFKQESRFTTWLYSIARNLCIDRSRRMKFRRHLSLDQPAGNAADGPERASVGDMVADVSSTPDRGATNREVRKRLTEAIANLKEDQREVFIMREYLGMPFKEIATVVGCPENTVKSRMRYALEALRRELDEYAEVGRGAAAPAVATPPLTAR